MCQRAYISIPHGLNRFNMMSEACAKGSVCYQTYAAFAEDLMPVDVHSLFPWALCHQMHITPAMDCMHPDVLNMCHRLYMPSDISVLNMCPCPCDVQDILNMCHRLYAFKHIST